MGADKDDNTMKLDPYDFTYFAAVNRLYPHAKIQPGSVEGPYCAVRKCSLEAKVTYNEGGQNYRLKLFTDSLKAKQWAEECECRNRKPEDHFVEIVESLEPPESVAFEGVEDWRLHHASELLQKWVFIAERLASGSATEEELNAVLASAVSSGKASWVSGNPDTENVDCMPTLCWANWHKMVRVEYREDLTTVEFCL